MRTYPPATLCLLAAISFAAAPSRTPDLAGTWTLEFESDPNDEAHWEPPTSECRFRQEGVALKGECGSDRIPVMGRISERHVTLTLSSAAVALLRADLDTAATAMKGTWQQKRLFGKFRATKR